MTSANLQTAHGVWLIATPLFSLALAPADFGLLTPVSLASSARPAGGTGKVDLGGVLAPVGMIIGVVILATGAIMLLRRKLYAAEASSDQTGLIMDELREMRQRGALSEAEYDAARAKLRDRLRGSVETPDAASASGASAAHGTGTLPGKETAKMTPRAVPRPASPSSSPSTPHTQRPTRPDKPPNRP